MALDACLKRGKEELRSPFAPPQATACIMTFRSLILLLGVCLLFAACDSGGSSSEGRRYFKFVHTSDSSTYIAATSDSEVLRDVEVELEKPLEERSKIINGPIARGDGGHNPGYPWHFIPDEWGLVDVAAEVCDGNPTYVSENVDYFVDEVGRYCPWSSKVLGEIEPPE